MRTEPRRQVRERHQHQHGAAQPIEFGLALHGERAEAATTVVGGNVL
jgi:hypothetical protein